MIMRLRPENEDRTRCNERGVLQSSGLKFARMPAKANGIYNARRNLLGEKSKVNVFSLADLAAISNYPGSQD